MKERPTELPFRNSRNEEQARSDVDEIIRMIPDDALATVMDYDSSKYGKHMKLIIIIPIGEELYSLDDDENDDATNNFEQIKEQLFTCRQCGFVRTPANFEEFTKKYGHEPSDDGEQLCDECINNESDNE